MSLDLPGNAASFSSRLKPARSTEGSRFALSTKSRESREGGGGLDRRRGSEDDGKVEGCGEGDGEQAAPGVFKRGRRGTGGVGEDGGANGVPKVGYNLLNWTVLACELCHITNMTERH